MNALMCYKYIQHTRAIPPIFVARLQKNTKDIVQGCDLRFLFAHLFVDVS